MIKLLFNLRSWLDHHYPGAREQIQINYSKGELELNPYSTASIKISELLKFLSESIKKYANQKSTKAKNGDE